MKVSLNLIRYYQKMYGWSADPAPEGIDALVQRIGAQLGGVDEVTDLGAKYQGAVIAKVVSCEPHPDSDHMHVCRIDDGGKTPDVARGEDGLVQVVCGAPNVRAGLSVVWLPPGSTVPESYEKEPFVLGARELRGVTSNGMLASSKELALGEDHDGILEIGDEQSSTGHPEQSEGSVDSSAAPQNDAIPQPGTPFAEAYGLDDYIIDIENKMFTHRPDLFGHFGVAREIAGIQVQAFTSPDWYRIDSPLPEAANKSLTLEFHNELGDQVPRFMLAPLSNVVVAPSPLWIQLYLRRLGIRPINNVVDITNYYMVLTGQPLHAYDYDKVKALSGGDTASISVRFPRSGETVELLNGKTVDPRDEAIMVASGDTLIGVGGVMGGSKTEVDEHTKNIILEVATFDMYSIRRTAMAHGLFTDAVTRFNKGQSPLQNQAVLAKVIAELGEVAGATLAGDIIDDNRVAGREWVYTPVPVTTQFINSRLGLDLSAEQMKTLLENVEFSIELQEANSETSEEHSEPAAASPISAPAQQLTVTAPFWRTDIETREDVVEEVGRLYGFDKLPVVLPEKSIKPVDKDPLLELKATVRRELAKAGANEVLNYSFVHGSLLDRVGQDKTQAYQVGNALSPDLQYYRLSLTPSLLSAIHPNVKAGYDEFALFEIGKAHNLQQQGEDGLPTEFEMLDVVYAATEKAGRAGAAFYQARVLLIALAKAFGLELEFRPFESEEAYQVVKPYDHTRSAQVFVRGTDLALGMIGEYKQSVVRNLKLPKFSAGFGIGLTQLLEAATKLRAQYTPLPRFPKVTQDITLKVPASVAYRDLYDLLETQLNQAKPEQTQAIWQPLDIYQREDDTEHKQVTFRLEIASYVKTLTDKEIATLLGLVANAAKEQFDAEQI